MYTVYAIKSLNRNYIYVGLTANLTGRIRSHKQGTNKTTTAQEIIKGFKKWGFGK